MPLAIMYQVVQNQKTKGFFCHLDLMDDKVTCNVCKTNNKVISY